MGLRGEAGTIDDDPRGAGGDRAVRPSHIEDFMKETPTSQEIASFLMRAYWYIYDRRPFEMATLAILNEKAFDITDAWDGAVRAKSIN